VRVKEVGIKEWQSCVEIGANLAIIICCVLLGIILVKRYLGPGPSQPSSLSQASQRTAPAPLKGKRLALSDIDWAKNEQTFVVFLQKGCRFCEESAPFYQRLVKELASQTRTQMIAALPYSIDEGKQYLKDEKLDISEVKQVAPQSVGIKGTPTLLLVDSSGMVLDEWVGKPSAEAEERIISRVK
jgi:ribosomal protein L20A (L18A)